MVYRDLLVLRGLSALLEIQDLLDHQDPVVLLAERVDLEIWDLLDPKDHKDNRCDISLKKHIYCMGGT